MPWCSFIKHAIQTEPNRTSSPKYINYDITWIKGQGLTSGSGGSDHSFCIIFTSTDVTHSKAQNVQVNKILLSILLCWARSVCCCYRSYNLESGTTLSWPMRGSSLHYLAYVSWNISAFSWQTAVQRSNYPSQSSTQMILSRAALNDWQQQWKTKTD